MGFIDRKKTNFYESQPLYSFGFSKTLLIVGLGNIGKRYMHNRHNVGFMALDRYRTSHELPEWIEKKDLHCYISSGDVGGTRLILIKPTTLMNLSGEAISAVQNFYKIDDTDTLVVYDELDVPFGTIRTRSGGGSAGHNGIKSLLQHTEGEVSRIRIGIGPKEPEQMDTADFVLQDFSEDQQKNLDKILREACVLIDERTTGPLTEQTIKVI